MSSRTSTRRARRSGPSVVVSSSRVQELEERISSMQVALEEARNSVRGQLSKSMAWDESEALGIPSRMRRINNLSEKEYKDTLCKAYMNMPWIGACIDARVLRMVSGTWELVPTCEDADEKVRDEIMELLLYVNDDEDLLQLIYSYGLDMMIYGEGYLEIVRGGKGKPADQPTSLHKIDCQTMTYDLDDKGNIAGYKQLLSHQTDPIQLPPDDVMRTWFPSPESSKKPLSPIAKLINAAMLYEQMMEWARSFFKKGARPPFSFKHPGDKRKAEEFLLWLRENFTGKQNAHVPLVYYDGVEIEYAPSGPVEMDFLKGLEWVRQETLSNLQTPPANIAIIATGAMSHDTGDSQSKTFENNAVLPLERLIVEKFNYAIIQKGFKTKQWKLKLNHASYADDEAVATLEDKRIRNGTSTVNEARVSMGKAPYEDYGDTPVMVPGNTAIPLERFGDIVSEQEQSAQLDLETKKAQVKKLKQPPAPPPIPPQNGQAQDPQDNAKDDVAQDENGKKQESQVSTAQEAHHFFVRASRSGGSRSKRKSNLKSAYARK